LEEMPDDRQPGAILSIAEGLDVVLLSDDEVLVQFGTRSSPSELLRDTDLKGFLGRIIGRLLQGPASLNDLLSDLRTEDCADARTMIDDLTQRGILTDIDRSPIEQYLRYTFTGDSMLVDRSVSLIGAGPIGARLAHSLLQNGLGRITLLDHRPADHLWHTFLPLGREPVQDPSKPAHRALRDHLLAAGHTRVECLDTSFFDAATIEEAVARSDFVVVALEQQNLQLCHLVNRFCVRDQKPWLLAMIDGNFGLIGPLFLPPHTACYSDYRTLADASTPSREMARKHRQHILQRSAASFFPGLPAYADVVAGHTALAVVDFLIRDTSFALGRVLVIDFNRMMIDIEDVLKLPRCPVCGTERSAYRPLVSPDPVTGS